MFSGCGCFIVPKEVIERFARDSSLPKRSRDAFQATAALEPIWRKLRVAQNQAIQASLLARPKALTLAAAPKVTIYDCQNTTSLPGIPVANPGGSADGTAKRAFGETTAVADFYRTCFGRNSIDDLGMTLMSSIHFDTDYNNAFWNGAQMTYGDGDGQIFIDFTNSNDVIAHELTHGVTQYTAGLVYTNEAGALNESVSDVFGSMFRQWQAKQSVTKADWLIGAGIIGPAAKTKGFTCLRDLSNPGAAHCLSPQPNNYANYVPEGDPHHNSGIPNYAFYLAAKGIGGQSWDRTGKIWYAALTDKKATKNMSFKSFAKLTRSAASTLFAADPAVYAAVDGAWSSVGVP
ncbi:M4 family metallopeptidase [Mesorhizobium sp.]|uniref:M4 family metallopeptidase n=1 Tax=Mesorhizobium sp. TaxID=1871066 RepID=UPI0012044824|nr:M4 family metallopeptidase [Mesorhizobium sp.]TIS58183.1 MAG: M4 family metallopeptidase [Mesorhizobium sp.]TIS87166.1 MAG: M4 family metallopeptidase [Mesorhizobium sp.]